MVHVCVCMRARVRVRAACVRARACVRVCVKINNEELHFCNAFPFEFILFYFLMGLDEGRSRGNMSSSNKVHS